MQKNGCPAGVTPLAGVVNHRVALLQSKAGFDWRRQLFNALLCEVCSYLATACTHDNGCA